MGGSHYSFYAASALSFRQGRQATCSAENSPELAPAGAPRASNRRAQTLRSRRSAGCAGRPERPARPIPIRVRKDSASSRGAGSKSRGRFELPLERPGRQPRRRSRFNLASGKEVNESRKGARCTLRPMMRARHVEKWCTVHHSMGAKKATRGRIEERCRLHRLDSTRPHPGPLPQGALPSQSFPQGEGENRREPFRPITTAYRSSWLRSAREGRCVVGGRSSVLPRPRPSERFRRMSALASLEIRGRELSGRQPCSLGRAPCVPTKSATEFLWPTQTTFLRYSGAKYDHNPRHIPLHLPSFSCRSRRFRRPSTSRFDTAFALADIVVSQGWYSVILM